MTKEVYISIEGGKIANRTTFQKWLWEHKDGRYLIRSENKKKRSHQQNAYIHAVLFPELATALKEVGYSEVDAEMAKDIAKKKFLTKKVLNENTEQYEEYIKDTSKLSTVEMSEFIEAVIRFAAEHLNYEIRYPNEQARINY